METWKKWNPISYIPNVFHLIQLLENSNGLILTFETENKKEQIIVSFEGLVLSYRSIIEGCFLESLTTFARNDNSDLLENWTLFILQNSHYKKWFLKECQGLYQDKEVTHFVFYTPNEVIEVLATQEPQFKVLKM